MKKAKDYWVPIFEDFIRMCPQYVNDDIVDWFPSGQMEITVKTRTGKMYAYDWFSKMAWPLHDSDDDDIYDDEEMWRRRFSLALNRKMRNMNVKQEDLSKLAGISSVTLSKYMNGRATPSGHNISKIARVLKCSATELMGGDY